VPRAGEALEKEIGVHEARFIERAAEKGEMRAAAASDDGSRCQ
jgi:hypothetical protein